MPGFVRTPKDEARWSRAKSAVKESHKKEEGSFEDQDWALVNSIYHKMAKRDLALDLLERLSKAPYNEDEDEEYAGEGDKDEDEEESDYDVQDHDFGDKDEEDLGSMGIHEFDPDQEGGTDSDTWLAENDPQKKIAGEKEAQSPSETSDEAPQEKVRSSKSGYSDWKPRTDYSDKEQADIKSLTDQGYSPREAEHLVGAHNDPTDIQSALRHTIRPSEMSSKMHGELKELAGHYLKNLSRHGQITADPERNPMKHAAGKMLQAHEGATKDYASAYNQFLDSDQVKGLKGMNRVRAINDWKNDWKTKNPDYQKGLSSVAQQVKEHAGAAQERHKMGVGEKISHIMMGGGSGGENTFSAQEAAQHVGGEKTEAGYQASTVQDPSVAFANQNQAALSKLKALNKKPEHTDRLKQIDSARATLNIAPKVIRRPGGQT